MHNSKYWCSEAKRSAVQKIYREKKLSYFDHMSPCCDLDLENSKQIVLHETPAHDDTSQYQVCKQNVWWFRRYHLGKNWHFDPLLWPWPCMQYFFFFHKALWLMMMYHKTKFGCLRISSWENVVERVIFWSYGPLLWPWPWK